jgi:hypothetical protein
MDMSVHLCKPVEQATAISPARQNIHSTTWTGDARHAVQSRGRRWRSKTSGSNPQRHGGPFRRRRQDELPDRVLSLNAQSTDHLNSSSCRSNSRLRTNDRAALKPMISVVYCANTGQQVPASHANDPSSPTSCRRTVFPCRSDCICLFSRRDNKYKSRIKIMCTNGGRRNPPPVDANAEIRPSF